MVIVFFPTLQAITMGVVINSNYVGEREVAWRIKIAGENLGWTVIIDENQGCEIQNMKELDWVICLIPKNEFSNPYCLNYQTIFHPFSYLDNQRKLVEFYEKYDGYLLTINDRETIEEGLKLKNKEFNFIPFYPTVYHVPYKKIELNNLFTTIPVWGNRLKERKFRTLYRFLSQKENVKFYGVNKNADIISNGYMGKIPFDGVSVINILQQHGIVLVIHSDIHNKEEIPSSRIFEAAAASTVIISDKNAFIKKYFGDSVLYIDTSLSAETIFGQIEEHLDFIYKNPEKALEMARKAHEIFIENFEMSSQLLKLETLHNEILLKRGQLND